MRRFGGVARSLVVVSLVFNQCAPAQAARLPMGGVATVKKLGGDSSRDPRSNRYNLSYVPVLLELARIMGRFQPGPGYYILNEPFANQPGIDLGFLLLQSGPLQLSESLTRRHTGTSVRQNKDQPSLAARPITEGVPETPRAEKATDLPQLAMRPVPIHTAPAPPAAAQIASPDNISLSVQGNQLSDPPPFILVDFTGLSAALTGIGSEPVARAWPETPRVRSSPYNPPPSNHSGSVSNAFMLFTLPATTSSTTSSSAVPEGFSSPYEGTFVVCQRGVKFKGMSNRQLELSQGRLLACNRGPLLIFKTDQAVIKLPSGTAALIDLNENKVLRVTALETSDSAMVTVEVNADATLETLPVIAGDELAVTGHTVTGAEAKGELKRIPPNTRSAVTRSKLPLTQILGREMFLNDQRSDLTDVQRSAITQLRRRILRTD